MTAIVLVATSVMFGASVLGCDLGQEKVSACEGNEASCPVSTPLSTDVGCDCRCVAGYSGLTPTREFEGEISACLPASLNAKLATPDQLAALEAMPSATFNQNVFKYCSNTVAPFLENLIEEQQRPPDLASMCLGPRIRCDCSTTGARGETTACSTQCVDKECDAQNCIPLLKVGGGVDASSCTCSRVSSCGASTPPVGEPPVCLNRVAAVLKRKAATPTPAPASTPN